MSRESLLDEAIVKAKEAEDWQLVEWLRMARGSESAARWYTAKLKELKAENAKLREMVRDMYKALFGLNLDHCQACPREDACVFVHKSFDCDECAFERDMRELGIEVDG